MQRSRVKFLEAVNMELIFKKTQNNMENDKSKR